VELSGKAAEAGGKRIYDILDRDDGGAVADDLFPPEAYEPLSVLSAADLLRRYAAGERRFAHIDLDGERLAGSSLEGAMFEWSWFHSVDFSGCKLRRARFLFCNVKCADFSSADLRGASFHRAAVEAANFEGALLDETSFEGSSCYGYTIHDGDGFPER
jgi:uncharacterized protein YjbI with pentapeptide repeats